MRYRAAERHGPDRDLATRIALQSETIAFWAAVAGLVLLVVIGLARAVT